MTDITLAPGMRVRCRDAEWLVKQVKNASISRDGLRAVHCVGVDSLVKGHEVVFLTDLDTFEVVDPAKTKLIPDTSSGYRKAQLYLEACLRQLPVTGALPDLENMGVFDPLEFQQQAVLHALSQPRVRLLLADDVGLGKTIQVGMILSELARRGRAARILVLAKKSMLTQFQSELWNRFTIPLTRLDSRGIQRLRSRIPLNKNPFEIFHRVIISLDTLKTPQYKHFLEKTRWDVVVIDEAHNVAAASGPGGHMSYRLARLLSSTAENIMLTTATPHNGKAETFGRLISLLDPSAIADPDLREYSAEDIQNFFLMRFKDDVRAELQDHMPERKVVPLADATTKANDAEEKIFAALATMRKEAKADKRRNRLLEYGVYKIFLSSPEACKLSVDKRIANLEAKDKEGSEFPALKNLSGLLKSQTITDSSRYKLLLRHLHEIGAGKGADSPRIVIFTEYVETQRALAEALAKELGVGKMSLKQEDQKEQAIAIMNGSFADEHLMKLVESFGTKSSPVRILIATDVASEGINLHHQCANLIHYDIPWSIITLIQRNGRIDRYGQTQAPVLRYLLLTSEQPELSGDKDLFERLVSKVEEINNTRCSGESVLKLYDADKEEEFIAEKGLLAANNAIFDQDNSGAEVKLERTIDEARLGAFDADFLAALSGKQSTTSQEPINSSRLRLLEDKDYFVQGYSYLRGESDDLPKPVEQGDLLMLPLSEDLGRYLGSKDVARDVIFGATAIPEEAFPGDGEFRLTSKSARVDLSIKAARNKPSNNNEANGAGHWSEETLLTDQHPILQWLTERLMMLHGKQEAPYITSPHLQKGELVFGFVGQLSSKAGTPLISSAHAIRFFPGGETRSESLRAALSSAKLSELANLAGEAKTAAADLLRESAVQESLRFLEKQKDDYLESGIVKAMRKEARRLREWSKRRNEFIKQKRGNISSGTAQWKKLDRLQEESEDFVKARDQWLSRHFDLASQPTTRLVLVIEGVE